MWVHRCRKHEDQETRFQGNQRPVYFPSHKQAPSRTVWCGLRKRGTRWCNAGESCSLSIVEFPSRVPTAAFHTPAPLQRVGYPSELLPWGHNRCVDAPRTSITHCLSSHSLHTVCGPCGEEQNDTKKREQTSIISYFENYLGTTYDSGNFIYIALFITSKQDVLFIGRQHVGPWYSDQPEDWEKRHRNTTRKIPKRALEWQFGSCMCFIDGRKLNEYLNVSICLHTAVIHVCPDSHNM